MAYLPPADGGVIDPAKVREVALAQLGTGVDVVYGVPGALSDPLFAAAQEQGWRRRSSGPTRIAPSPPTPRSRA